MDYSIDGAGIARLYYTRGGGYYVDVGCSKLIIEGKIKVQQSPGGISGFKPNALVLKDGTELEADVVVLATGFDNMKTTAQKVMGDKVASRLKDVWDLDEEGELNAVSFITFAVSIFAQQLLTSSPTDVASERAPQLLVHGRQPGHLSHLFQVCGSPDQGTGGGLESVAKWNLIASLHEEDATIRLLQVLP